jgi:hypothetical protein
MNEMHPLRVVISLALCGLARYLEGTVHFDGFRSTCVSSWEEAKLPVRSKRRATKLEKPSDIDTDEVSTDQTFKYLFYNTQETLRLAVSMNLSRVADIEHLRVVMCSRQGHTHSEADLEA